MNNDQRKLLYFREKIRRFIKEYWIWIFCFLIILAESVIQGISASYICNFYPIDGTFQNYNPVRRLISGQVPCRDFCDYLGLGHLYLGSICTFLFGSGYAGSLAAFSFLAFIPLVFFSYIICKAVTRKPKISIVVTTLITTLVLSSSLNFTDATFLQKIWEMFSCSLSTGNSARFLRGFALVVFVFAVEINYWIISKIRSGIYSEKYRQYIQLIGYSVAAGFIFPYSNDFGIGTWICAGIMLTWILICRRQKIYQILISILEYVVVSALSTFLFVSIFTRGNFSLWVRQTLGVGSFQTWYYFAPHKYYAYEFDHNNIVLIQAAIVIIDLIMIYRSRGNTESIKRYGLTGLFNMTSFCVINEYCLLSGGELHEVGYSILGMTIISNLVSFLYNCFEGDRKKKICRFCSLGIMIFGFTYMISSALDEKIMFLDDTRGTYVAGMGYLTSLAGSLKSAQDYIGNKKVFSTYSSALETTTNQVKPSKYDYIIHVLGDRARQEYLSDFDRGDFDYATTIRESYDGWEIWIRNANWFFYRDLYENYHPVFANEYELFWEKNDNDDENKIDGIKGKITCKRKCDYSYEITVNMDKKVNGIADISLNYATNKGDSRRSKLMFFRCIEVDDATENVPSMSLYNHFELPEKGNTDVPIQIVDGVGKIDITSRPADNTTLTISSYKLNSIYTVTYQSMNMLSVVDNSDNNCTITFENTPLNKKISSSCKTIRLGKRQISMHNLNVTDDGISVIADCSSKDIVNAYGKNNMIYVTK